MITLLPHQSMVRSMEFLDEKCLKKQQVEIGQILEIILGKSYLPASFRTVVPFNPKFLPWQRHPAILMWRDHTEWLKLYLACAIGEWCSRGHSPTIDVPAYDTSLQKPPPFIGLQPFHLSHRAYLIRRNPAYYLRFWPKDRDDDLPIYWPSDHAV